MPFLPHARLAATCHPLPPFADLCHDTSSGFDVIQLVLSLLFFIDIFVNFNVAVWDRRTRQWVTDRRVIARHYVLGRVFPHLGMFWVDVVAVFPFDWVLGDTYGCGDVSDNEAARLVRLLRLLRLFRLVRSRRRMHPMHAGSSACMTRPYCPRPSYLRQAARRRRPAPCAGMPALDVHSLGRSYVVPPRRTACMHCMRT